MIKSLWKTLCFSSYPHLGSNPEVPLLGIYPREMKLHSHKDLYSNIHSNIILNSPTVNNQKSPSIGDWINKLWSIHNGCYSATEGHEPLKHPTRMWVNLKGIMLKQSPEVKVLYYMRYFIYIKFYKRWKAYLCLPGARHDGRDLTAKGQEVTFWWWKYALSWLRW